MKVIGINGIYFQSNDPARLSAWYAKHLGVRAGFIGSDIGNPDQYFCTVWRPLNSAEKIFVPGKKAFAIDYRVDDLKALVASLRAKGFDSTVGETSEGTFAHFLDPEGNNVILSQRTKESRKPGPGTQPNLVTGLGGVFFKSTDAKNLGVWYGENLGLNVTEWGCSFEWMDPKDPDAKAPATTAWSTFASTTTYFAPSEKDFMFNYRVKNLHALLAALKLEGVESVGELQEESYGKFGWIIDPEGNKMELWEPVDGGF